MDEWTNGRMDEWTNGLMDEWLRRVFVSRSVAMRLPVSSLMPMLMMCLCLQRWLYLCTYPSSSPSQSPSLSQSPPPSLSHPPVYEMGWDGTGWDGTGRDGTHGWMGCCNVQGDPSIYKDIIQCTIQYNDTTTTTNNNNNSNNNE